MCGCASCTINSPFLWKIICTGYTRGRTGFFNGLWQLLRVSVALLRIFWAFCESITVTCFAGTIFVFSKGLMFKQHTFNIKVSIVMNKTGQFFWSPKRPCFILFFGCFARFSESCHIKRHLKFPGRLAFQRINGR